MRRDPYAAIENFGYAPRRAHSSSLTRGETPPPYVVVARTHSVGADLGEISVGIIRERDAERDLFFAAKGAKGERSR